MPAPLSRLSEGLRESRLTPPVAVISPPSMLMVVLLRVLPPEPMPAPEAQQDPFSSLPPLASMMGMTLPSALLRMVMVVLPTGPVSL